MKKCLLWLIVAIILIPSAVPVSAASESGLVWLAKPTLGYEKIYYCGACNLLGEEKRGYIDIEVERYNGTNIAEMLIFIEQYNIKQYDNKNILYIGVGHGDVFKEYFYDEKADIFVEHISGDTTPEIKFYTPAEFKNIWNFQNNYIIALRKIDSEKARLDESTSNFDYTHTGDKYALMYGGEFISGFIYDDYERRGTQFVIPEMTKIKRGENWGVVGKTGAVLLPFIFEDIEFFSDGAAFAKYNGKYGILDLNATIAAYAENPATGGGAAVYYYAAVVLISAIFVMIKYKKIKQYCKKGA